MEEKQASRALGPKDTMLQYNKPELVSKRLPKQDVHFHSLEEVPMGDVSNYFVLPENKTATSEEILDFIFPPREWEENGHLWRQTVSPHPVTSENIAELSERLDSCLQEQGAKEDGIDAVRSTLLGQFFDEIIRIETVICGERGLLLGRIRDDLKYTMSIYRKLYESCMGYAVRKSLQAEKEDRDEAKNLEELKGSTLELQREIEKVKEKISKLQIDMQDQRNTEMRDHEVAMTSLKEINQEMKAQLRTVLKPKRQK